MNSSELLFLKMAFRTLAEAGFVGLEDNRLPGESDHGWQPKSTASESEMKVSDDRYNKMGIPGVDPQVFYSSSDLLTELRQVHMLDELIVEERLKISMFRQEEKPDEELSRTKIQDSNRLYVKKGREAFQLQLEKEKREVDQLEKSLETECKAKKQKDKSRKVIRCSIMEKTRTEENDNKAHSQDLSGTSNRLHPTFLVCSDSEPKHKTEHHEEVLDPHILINKGPNHLIQLPASQADNFECEASALSSKTTDVKPVQPLEGVWSGNPTKPEAALTPELTPDDGAFDPGGNGHILPVTKPRRVLLVKDSPSENEAPYSTEIQISSLLSATDLISKTAVPDELTESSDINRSSTFTANMTEYHHNSNRMTAKESEIPCCSETNTEDEDDTVVVFKSLEEEDLQLVGEMRTLSPVSQCLHPEPLPELELSGRNHWDEDLADCVQPSDWMKVSGCEPAHIEAQLDICIRKVMRVCIGLIFPAQNF